MFEKFIMKLVPRIVAHPETALPMAVLAGLVYGGYKLGETIVHAATNNAK